jgi:hypothetical protein
MTTKPPYPTARPLSGRVLIGLLMTLTAWTSAWPQARMRDAGNAPLRPPARLRVHIDAAVTRTVSAQFTAMALDQGLRRLLRVTSLSYALLYTRGPDATAILHEVRVFGEERPEEPANHDQAPIQPAQHAAAQLSLPAQEEHVEPQPTEPEPDADALAESATEAHSPED